MIKIIELEKNIKIWRGALFRKYNVGLNTEDSSKDYYDYILAQSSWDKDYMILVNISSGLGRNKAGSVYSGVIPVDTTYGESSISKQVLSERLDNVNEWYLISS